MEEVHQFSLYFLLNSEICSEIENLLVKFEISNNNNNTVDFT